VAFLQAELSEARAENQRLQGANQQLRSESAELRSQCGVTESEVATLQARLHCLRSAACMEGPGADRSLPTGVGCAVLCVGVTIVFA